MRLLLAALSAFVAIGLAGPAHGDPDVNGGPDHASFLASLQAAGITYSQPDQAIAAAKVVCWMADNGRAGPEVVKFLLARNPALTPERAAQFMAIAERSYCPHQLAPGNIGD